MKKSGFTLSEVLLTLGIIGVVAAMTVPSLMNSTEDKKLSAAAKKAYNTLQNAVSQKQALTELTPEDSEISIIGFLAGSSADGVRVLKFNNSNLGTDVDAGTAGITQVQLPDGQLMIANNNTGKCGGETGPANCIVMVDVNGEAGPSFYGIGVSGTDKTSGGAKINPLEYKAPAAYARNMRDLVHFEIDGMNVRPHPESGTAQRYIQGIMKK